MKWENVGFSVFVMVIVGTFAWSVADCAEKQKTQVACAEECCPARYEIVKGRCLCYDESWCEPAE